MPEFSLGPTNPAGVIGRPTTGQVIGSVAVNPNSGKLEGVELVPARAPGGGGGGGGAATAPKPEKKKKKKKKKPQKPTPAAYNPFTAPFKTPAELRAEAARLAALGSPTEEALRAEQMREEAGLAGLTGGLTGALGGVREAQTAGLAGLTSLYGQLSGAVQGAAQSAAAAAGAPTDIAATGTPTAVASFLPTAAGPGLGAAVRAYETVAPIIGAQMVGASRANLAKALTQRASQISSDTAKYLRQLQQEEVDRAIAQTTAQQNAARLALSEQGQQFEQQVDMANLGLRGQTVQQGWARIDQQLQQDVAKAGKDRRKKIQSAKDSILENIKDWTGTQTVSTGEGVYDVTVDMGTIGGGPKAVQVVATSPEAARQIAQNTYQNRPVSSVIFVRENQIQRAPTPQEIRRTLVARLVNAGMNRKAATQWVNANVVSLVAPSTVGTGGAFMGGVGGSTL